MRWRNYGPEYLSEARARRVSGLAGRRFESIRAIREAAAIRPSLELRNEAIACMVLADIKLLERKSFSQQRQVVAGDPSFEHFALCDRSGSVSIRRLSDGVESARLPAVGPIAAGLSPFSLDGKWLAVFYKDNRWRVWDWAKPAMAVEVASIPGGDANFAPDSRRIAFSDSTNILVHELSCGERLNSISLNGLASQSAPGWLRFDPSGRLLALFKLESGTNVLIADTLSGRTITTLPHADHVFAVSWHPDGRQLATASGEGSIHIRMQATENGLARGTLNNQSALHSITKAAFSLHVVGTERRDCGNSPVAGNRSAFVKAATSWDLARVTARWYRSIGMVAASTFLRLTSASACGRSTSGWKAPVA